MAANQQRVRNRRVETLACAIAASGCSIAVVGLTSESLREAAAACNLRAYDLRAETHRRGYVDVSNPLLSWKLALAAVPSSTFAVQSAYRVVAAASADDVLSGRYSFWDSGWVSSNDTINIEYSGIGLVQPADTVYWSVAVADATGAQFDFSVPESVTLAPRPADAGGADWAGATFITANSTMQSSDCECYDPEANAMPIMRTLFTPVGDVSYAHLFVLGLGYFEAFVSGHRVGSAAAGESLASPSAFGYGFGAAGASIGDDVLSPPWSTFSSTAYYSAYNVTSYLADGGKGGAENVLGIILGRGFYDPYPMRLFGSFDFRSFLPIGRPQAIVLLVLKLLDGSRQYVISSADNSVQEWVRSTVPGPLQKNNVYIGEVYDARNNAALAGWTTPSYNAGDWVPVLQSNSTNIGTVRLDPIPPVRITRAFAPTAITQPVSAPAGTYVLHFPVNMAGWISISNVSGPAGTVINFTYAEIINSDGSGDINTITNLAGAIGRWNGSTWGECAPVPAQEVDTWILAGTGDESYTPKFTWHAFQFVRIDGWPVAEAGPPQLSQFMQLQIHVDNEPAGDFSSWNQQHMAIDALVLESFRSNWAGGIQSDCPGRERLGYGGDLLAAADAAAMQFDVGAFYAKRVQDYADSQTPEGGLPETAPFVGIATCDTFGDGTGPMQWGAAHTQLQVEELLPYYGLLRTLKQQYNSSLKWLNHLNASSTAAGILDNGLCDFTFNSDVECGCAKPYGTAYPLMGTAFFYRQAANMAEIARVTGNAGDAEAWGARAATIAATFLAEFVNASSGVVGVKNADGVISPLSASDPWTWALGLGLIETSPSSNSSSMLASVSSVLQGLLVANGSHAFLGAFGTSYLYRFAPYWRTSYDASAATTSAPMSALSPAGQTASPPGSVLELASTVDASRGMLNLAYTTLSQTDYPSYGLMLAYNSTSLWEHWDNGWALDSFNHAWLGSVSSFFRGIVGGIRPDRGAVGFDRIRIRPMPPLLGSSAALPQQPGQPPSNSTSPPPVWANTTYRSIRGDVTTAWVLQYASGSDGTSVLMSLNVSVPPNVAVVVELPLIAPVSNSSPASSSPSAAAVAANYASCAWASGPILDSAAGVARWTMDGYTACSFTASW